MPLLGPSGASAHLRGLAGALAARGPVAVVARRVDGRGAVVDWPGPVFETVEAAWSAAGPFDLIWERHSLGGEAGRRLAAARGLPRWVEVNAPLARERARYAGLRRWDRHEAWEAASLAAADRVLPVSAWLADWAVGLGVSRSKIRLVRNGSGLVAASPPPPAPPSPVLGVFGSWRPWIGLERLPAWLDALPDWRARVVGQGAPRPPNHPRLHAEPSVPPDRLAAELAACTVLLDPTPAGRTPWRCPLRVLDALAVGVPVVAAGPEAHALFADGGGVSAHDDWPAAIEAAARLARQPRPRGWAEVVAEALAG